MDKQKRVFQCFGCKNVFKTSEEACLHYDKDVVYDDGDEDVSLCDSCTANVQETAKRMGIENELPKEFFKH